MPRRLANVKRISLEGLSDGWTDECYALIVPAGYLDVLEINKLSLVGDNDKLVKWQIAFVKNHLVSGKVMVLDDNNQLSVDDLVPTDVEEDKRLADVLFNEIMGVTADPKDLSTKTGSQLTPSSSDEPLSSMSSTKTQ